MPRRHLTRFRVQGIYSPALLRALTRPLAGLGRDHAPRLRSAREEAGNTVALWRARPLAARAGDWSFPTMVADPPPAGIVRHGRTYYLTHFNAYRAIYSPSLPPAEPTGR